MKLIRIAIFILCFLSLSAFCYGQTNQSIQGKYDQGLRLFEDGKLLESIPYFEEVYKVIPSYLAVRKYLIVALKYGGIEYYTLDRYTDAIEVWRKALKIDPGNKEIASFIERVNSEIKMLNLKTDSNIKYEEKPVRRKPPVSKPPATDTVIVNNYMKVHDKQTDAIEYSKEQRRFTFGTSGGMVFSAGDGTQLQRAGWTFSGNILIPVKNDYAGLQLDGMYIKLDPDKSISNDGNLKEYYGILGGRANMVWKFRVSRISSFKLAAGIGLYQSLHSWYNKDLEKGGLDRETGHGFNFGLGWQIDFSKFAASINVGYSYIDVPIEPRLVEVSISLSSR